MLPLDYIHCTSHSNVMSQSDFFFFSFVDPFPSSLHSTLLPLRWESIDNRRSFPIPSMTDGPELVAMPAERKPLVRWSSQLAACSVLVALLFFEE
jgi:hypothetical protein